MGVRRVTTGHGAGGRSVFDSDVDVDETTLEMMPGIVFRHLWASQATPAVPVDSPADLGGPYFPSPGGVRVVQVVFPPQEQGGGVPPADLEAATAEVEEKLPGLISYMELDEPGMHTTDTVDIGVVVEGEVYLELDEGAEKHLAAGEVVVQNGTRHRWHNRSERPCVMTFVLVGATRR